LKTALVHDWLLSHGGAEEVLRALYSLFPSDVFTLAKDPSVVSRYQFPLEKVHSSFIEKFPSVHKYYKYYLPLFPLAIEQFDMSEYDTIISSSHCVAKGVLTSHEQLHFSYCHSPMRYAWDLYHEYLKNAKLERGVKGWFAQMFLHKLRMWDFASSQRVDHFIANSHYIARRIKKVYGRDSTVIYPPVNTEKFAFEQRKEDYYVTASRLVPYKKVDLIVQAFNNMPSKKLIVIGSGDELEKLQAIAQPNVTLLGFVETDEMKQYFQNAKGFLFAALEDFGILPIEAQSCGTPVICLGRGGTKETVIDGKTGVHFEQQSADAIQKAVEYFETQTFDPFEVREHAMQFSDSRFKAEIASFVSEKYEAFLNTR